MSKNGIIIILFLIGVTGFGLIKSQLDIQHEAKQRKLSVTRSFVQIGESSGFIINKIEEEDDRYCYILTCYHVVDNYIENKTPIYVTLPRLSGDKIVRKISRSAEVVYTNKEKDYAILKVPWTFYCIKAKFERIVKVGDEIISVGRPNRVFRLGFGHITQHDNFLGHDANVFYGSSGGPIFNSDYKVIGMNRAMSSYAGRIPLPFLGYAIKISTILDDLKPKQVKKYFGEQ